MCLLPSMQGVVSPCCLTAGALAWLLQASSAWQSRRAVACQRMKEAPHADCALQEPGADARQDRAPGLLRNFSISRGSQAARSSERGGGGSPMGKLLRRTSLAQHPQESNMVPPGGSFRCTRSGGPECTGWHAGCW